MTYANEVGRELSRRFDWSDLYEETTVNGTGADALLSLPSGFSRAGKGVSVSFGGAALRPLTQREWGTLTPTEGTPRYYLLEGNGIKFWPYMSSGAGATVGYISENWCNGGSEFTSDADTVIFPDELFALGLIVRWRRQKGMDYADFEAEYEAALMDHAKFDRNVRF